MPATPNQKAQDFPVPADAVGYPMFPGITANGRTLVVPLGLTHEVAVVDVKSGKATNVPVGRSPTAPWCCQTASAR